MKQQSSLDLYFLIKEIKSFENSRIETFYYEDEIFYLKIYTKGNGHKYLVFKVGKYFYTSDKKEEASEPSSFISYLRKYLKNGFLDKIDVLDGERIIKLEINKKVDEIIKKYFIFLEVFQPGNIILTDDNLNILNILKRKTFKDRKVAVREIYELPPKKEISIHNINRNVLISILSQSDLSLVKFIAIKFGTGGKFAEEISLESGIDKLKKVSELSESEIDSLLSGVGNVLDKSIEANLSGGDFYPFKFRSNLNQDISLFSSFNEVIENYYEIFKDNKDKKEEEFNKELQKLKNRLNKQEQLEQEILGDYEILNLKGNKIYEHFALVDELLRSINKSAKEKGWDYVLEVVKHNERLSKVIKNLNYKNNEIILNLE